MLCDVEFVAQKQSGYNAKWGVVFNKNIVNGRSHGEDHINWPEKLNTGFYSKLNFEINSKYSAERMTPEGQRVRDKLMDYLTNELYSVYPNAHLICSGSSISKCGTLKSDMDLCYALKTSEHSIDCFNLPIGRYMETGVNKFMIDRLHKALRENEKIQALKTVDAKVPIVKFNLDIKDVDPNEESALFEFDINCNCVAGVYNAFLLGALANYDDRLPKLAIILKEWGKHVKVVSPYTRFNSYLVVLLLVHYLQCGVNPPVLPNLMLLQPEDFDGTKDPWDLTTKVDRSKLPEPENKMSVGALLCGFFRYYSQFDFDNYGILIKDASVIKMNRHGNFNGLLGSRIFVEEPYDGLTVAKNVKKQSDFDHIKREFMIGRFLLHQFNSEKKNIPPELDSLFKREEVPKDVATREDDVENFKFSTGN